MDPNEGEMKTVRLDKPAPGSRAGRRVLPQSPAHPQAWYGWPVKKWRYELSEMGMYKNMSLKNDNECDRSASSIVMLTSVQTG